MLRRGQQLYYRHTVPVDAQRLLNRLEIWRLLRTDSLSVALRRLPRVVARIETEIEHARAVAGMPVDAILIQPLADDPVERLMPIPIAFPLVVNIEPNGSLTLARPIAAKSTIRRALGPPIGMLLWLISLF